MEKEEVKKEEEVKEEEKEKPKKEDKEEAPPIAEAPEEKAAVAPEVKEAPPAKKKKINRMTLEEIKEKLKAVEERMGGFESKYAQELLKRKNTLGKLK
jgi:hypothetical protein